MTKRWFSIPAFLTAWMFIFSTLSTCYCLPTEQVGAPTSFSSDHSAQSDMQSGMPAHCQHHSDTAKEKQSDCSPRYNTDQFENTVVKARSVHAVAFDLPLTQIKERQIFPHSVNFESKPFLDSSPPIYILVRSLLI